MKFFCLKTFVALVAIIGFKSEAASLKNGLLRKAIVRRSSQGCVFTCADVTTYHQSNHYAFCGDCSKFVQCANGQTFVNNCPANTLWDDNIKNCNFDFLVDCSPTTTVAPPPTTTTTTTAGPTTTTTAPTTTTTLPTGPPGQCITSCAGIADGDYQSCNGCDVYASCGGGVLYDNRPCAAAGLVWDDFLKICNYTSTSCPP